MKNTFPINRYRLPWNYDYESAIMDRNSIVTIPSDYIDPDMALIIQSYLKPGMTYCRLEFKSNVTIEELMSFFNTFGIIDAKWQEGATRIFVHGEDIALTVLWAKARRNITTISGIAQPAVINKISEWVTEQESKAEVGVPITIFEKFVIEKTKEIGTTTHSRTTADFSDVFSFLYPGLDSDKFVESYIKSKETIAFLVGAPGTGKTSLVKKIIHDLSLSLDYPARGVYVKDAQVLRDDEFWSDLVWTEPNFLILDDLDNELSPREGQTIEALKDSIVNRLLSFSNGIFSPYTKIVVTTNLEAESIDKALLRPGRCFDILRLKPLTKELAEIIWTHQLGQSADTFKRCFGDRAEISQAFFISEYNKVIKESPAYLVDPSLSVRKEYTGFSKPSMRIGK